MKVLFCAYRDWTRSVLNDLRDQYRPSDVGFTFAASPEEMRRNVQDQRFDLIVVVGWSWIIDESIVNDNVVVGMHPSKLPDYAGGSPIQHQIIDGLKGSEATLFQLTSKLDGGGVWGSEPFSLEGHLDDVLDQLSNATTRLLVRFLDAWPNVEFKVQAHGTVRKRLKPEQSELTKETLASMTCERLYDLIRCREDPYPNTFLEDETGRLVFKRVEFVPK